MYHFVDWFSPQKFMLIQIKKIINLKDVLPITKTSNKRVSYLSIFLVDVYIGLCDLHCKLDGESTKIHTNF